MRIGAGLAAMVGLAACGSAPERSEPAPVADPGGCLAYQGDEVRAELAEPGSWSTQVALRNDCEAPIAIIEAVTSDPAFSVSGVPAQVGAGGDISFDLTYEPARVGSVRGELRVRVSADPADDLVVALRGSLAGGELHVEGDGVTDPSPVGCDTLHRLSVSNTGTLPVTVSEVGLVGGGGFELLDVDGEIVVAAGGSHTLELRHVPDGEGRDTATLRLVTDQPFDPVVEHELIQDSWYANPATATGTIRVPVLDVLMTMDRSSCSYDHLVTVPEAVESLRDALADVDYRFAITVTDSGCILGDDPFIDPTFSAARAMATATAMIDKDFEASPYGANAERGFTLAQAALSAENTGRGGCSGGSFRDDAFLHIIHHSDEPDQSPQAWSYYVELFRGLKDGRVMQHAVAGPAPSGCASAAYGAGYWEAVEETGGLFRSICHSDGTVELRPGWEDHFDAFGATMIDAAAPRIPLDALPLPGETLTVTIDGLERADGWRYLPEERVVRLEIGAVEPGDEVVVTYQAVPESCP